ncbi:MAG: hypothetical protein PVH61_31605 [Candidatus Aminicenantes bacterium]|jgi:hypothetical protein
MNYEKEENIILGFMGLFTLSSFSIFIYETVFLSPTEQNYFLWWIFLLLFALAIFTVWILIWHTLKLIVKVTITVSPKKTGAKNDE